MNKNKKAEHTNNETYANILQVHDNKIEWLSVDNFKSVRVDLEGVAVDVPLREGTYLHEQQVQELLESVLKDLPYTPYDAVETIERFMEKTDGLEVQR